MKDALKYQREPSRLQLLKQRAVDYNMRVIELLGFLMKSALGTSLAPTGDDLVPL